jgi:transcriptional regulator with XRE-family HTH domain
MRKLRYIRQAKGLSIENLSKETGVNYSTIQLFETGKTNMKKGLLKVIADFLGSTIEELSIEVIKNEIKEKKCQNQRCPLNKQCYCQSDQVVAGAYCKSQDLVTEQQKKISFNSPAALFID